MFLVFIGLLYIYMCYLGLSGLSCAVSSPLLLSICSAIAESACWSTIILCVGEGVVNKKTTNFKCLIL